MSKKFNFVYATTNLINGKQYVGDHSTNNLKDGYLGSGIPYFKNAKKKYGEENFKRKILEYFNTKQEAFDAQEKYINEHNTLVPNGYNISPKGGVGCVDCFSEETKEKLSKVWKGKKHTKEAKELIGLKNSRYWKNKKLSEKHREKISESLKGKKHSQETKEKMRASHLGKKLSEETKQKLSKINKGRTFTEEHRKKISIAKKGVPSLLKGIKLSEETKKKISINNGMKDKGYLISGQRNGNFGKKGEKNHNFGRIFIYNEKINKCKRVKSNELDYYFNIGWKRGKK